VRNFRYGHFQEAEVEALREIEGLFKRSRREYLSNTSPNQRFRDFLRKECLMVQCNNQFHENVWSWNDSVVFEIETAKWDDCPESISWLWYWRKAYVVDSKRGCGVFGKFCNEIQSWCDRSGVVLCFVAKSFGFGTPSDTDDVLDYVSRPASWLDTVGDVSCAWNSILMSPFPDEWLMQFYKSRGFTNGQMTFRGLCEDVSVIPFERQFVYVGKEADWCVRDVVRDRCKLGK